MMLQLDNFCVTISSPLSLNGAFGRVSYVAHLEQFDISRY